MSAKWSEDTDFAQILSELREWGVNDYRMAELTGIERSKLSKFRTGDRKQPTFHDGVLILRQHEAAKKQRQRR